MQEHELKKKYKDKFEVMKAELIRKLEIEYSEKLLNAIKNKELEMKQKCKSQNYEINLTTKSELRKDRNTLFANITNINPETDLCKSLLSDESLFSLKPKINKTMIQNSPITTRYEYQGKLLLPFNRDLVNRTLNDIMSENM